MIQLLWTKIFRWKDLLMDAAEPPTKTERTWRVGGTACCMNVVV